MADDYTTANTELGRLYAGHIETIGARYDRALDKCGAASVVIFSGAPRTVFLDDQHYPFRPNAHFLNWVPLPTLPYSYVVYTPGHKPILIYFSPRDYWNPVPGRPEGYWTAYFDVRVVHDTGEIAAQLPTPAEKCILIGEIEDSELACGIERINPGTALNILHFERGIKTGYELACMRLASRRAAAGHIAAEESFRSGASEFEINQAYCDAVGHTENELPYGNIIALNNHGSVLHYTELRRDVPEESLSFLIDAGAQVHGYASDITRTYSFQDSRFAELVERVDLAQQQLTSQARAGINFAELHLEAHRIMAGVLVDAGIVHGQPETLLSTGVTAAFFPHGLGHLLGLQVHDAGGHMADESGTTADPPSGHPFLRLTRKLEENMVVTIEPGLYVIDMLLENLRGTPAEQYVNWTAVDWLRPFGGIRIEDNVRITNGACENLTRDAFASLN